MRAEIFRKSEIRKQRGKLVDCEEDRLGSAREQWRGMLFYTMYKRTDSRTDC